MTRFVDNYLAALLAWASHLISSEFHAVVRENGLSVSEWRVLASLAGGEPIAIGQLAQVGCFSTAICASWPIAIGSPPARLASTRHSETERPFSRTTA